VAARSIRFVDSWALTSSASRPSALANGAVAADRATILVSPGDIEGSGDAEFFVFGDLAVPAAGAVAHINWAQDGVYDLRPVGDELGLIARPGPGVRRRQPCLGGLTRVVPGRLSESRSGTPSSSPQVAMSLAAVSGDSHIGLAEEAVSRYREQAAATPAFRPDPASALTGTGRVRFQDVAEGQSSGARVTPGA
jgi:hypothetical protein